MEINEFKERAAKQYYKLGVKSFNEFLVLLGYSEANNGKSFYRKGVGKRAIAYLEMVEKMQPIK